MQTFKDGAAGIQKYREQAELFGISLDRKVVAKAERARTALGQLEGATRGIQENLLGEFGDFIADQLDGATKTVIGFNRFITGEEKKHSPPSKT